MGLNKKGKLAGKEREWLRELCQLDLLKKMYDYRPEGVHVPGLNLSAQGHWAMTVTQTILPNINIILRLLHEHWDVFTPVEQRLISDYEGNVRSFEEDWKAGNHSPRCIMEPKGLDEVGGHQKRPLSAKKLFPKRYNGEKGYSASNILPHVGQ